MTRRLNYFCALALMMLFATLAIAQPKATTDDDVVQDPDGQHREWKKGTQKYPSKPKDMIEIGLHGGSFIIAGDVVPELGWAAGLHVRKSLGYSFSLRLNGFYGVARGLNHNPNRVGAYQNTVLRNVGGTGYGRSVNGNAGSGLPWFHNYKTTYTEVSLQGVVTLNNLKFHKERNKWNLYGIFGLGTHIYTAKYDALNGEGNTYAAFAGIPGSFDVSEASGRRDARSAVRDELDGEYETNAEQWDGLFKLFDLDDATMNLIANVGVGLGYKLSNRINLTLEHQVTLSDDDLIDGYRWAEQGDLTRSADLPQYTSLRLGINLGSFEKRVEPLWWVNPLDAPYEAIAKNTQKDIEGILDDGDGDGVPDKLDREPDTPADCPVDTRGVTLDSDGDGVADCNDKEPYSPPGFPVDADGIAQVTPPMNEGDVLAIGEREGWGTPTSCATDWFLPMIHFDLDKFYMKPEFFPQLHHVANVMTSCPELKVVVKGYTDVRNPNDYNQVLSYKRAKKAYDYLIENYGISADRLVLQYGGEENPLVKNLPDSHSNATLATEQAQYMNRRVEFHVADGGESSMGQPAFEGDYEKVGKDTPKSSRGSKIYSGNGIY